MLTACGDADDVWKTLGEGSGTGAMPLKEFDIDARPFIKRGKQVVAKSTKAVRALSPHFVNEVKTRIANLSKASTRDDALDWFRTQGKDAAHVILAEYTKHEPATKRDLINLLNYDNMNKESLAKDALYFTLAEAFSSDWQTGLSSLYAAGHTIMRHYEERTTDYKFGPTTRDTISKIQQQEYESAREKTLVLLKKILNFRNEYSFSPFRMTAARIIIRYRSLDLEQIIPIKLQKKMGVFQFLKIKNQKNNSIKHGENVKNEDFYKKFFK